MAAAVVVRPAAVGDVPAIVRVYNHYILHSSATFHEAPVSEAYFAARIGQGGGGKPFLVAVGEDGAVAGFAGAGEMKGRCGYRWTLESSVYVAPDCRRAGVGGALLAALIEAAAAGGARNLVAVVSLPNPASIALHEKCGYAYCGTLPGIGYKFGQWFDVGYWVRRLGGPL